MKTAWGFYTGLMEGDEDCEAVRMVTRKRTTTKTAASAQESDDVDVVGFSAGGSVEFLSSPLASICKVLASFN